MCNALIILSNDPNNDHNKEGKYLQHAQTCDPQQKVFDTLPSLKQEPETSAACLIYQSEAVNAHVILLIIITE